MSAHTAYYQVPPYTQHAAIPQGWRPPFQGPPPIPSGMNINPQLWQAGRWQLNQAYFAQHQGVPQPQHAWAASQAWQQSRSQESASKNPYKRTTKPPSAEYLATSLSDNPLGLTDMIPAEEYYAQQHATEMANDSHRSGTAVAESPWIWNPPSLAPDEDDAAEPPPNSSTHDSSRPRTPSRPASGSSQRDSATSQQPSTPNAEERKEDPFTSKRALVPTFSTNIVRTPEHYKSSPSRSSSRSSHTNRSSRSSTDPQQLVSRMESLDISSPNSSQFTAPDTTGSREHAQTMSGVQNLVEEPITSLLSPLLLTTPKPQSRPLGRYSTFPMVNGPASLGTIPEAPTTSKSDQHSLRGHKSLTRHPSRVKTDPVVDSHHHNHSPNYPVSTSPYFNPSPSRSSRSSSSSRASSQQPSPTTSLSLSPHDYHTSPPTSGSSRHSNPLPAPPAEFSNHSFSLSGKGTARSSKRKRKGFWNKRGDYFTRSGYVVYAPHDQAYPPELQDYPEESQGFADETGQRLSPGPRLELPESVPRHGQPPIRPYHSFIEYI